MESFEAFQSRKYREYKRKKRREAFFETLSAIFLLGLAVFMIKLWFVAEGFSIQW